MRIFCYAAWRAPKWGFWFRIFGRGLYIGILRPSFSERYGYSKVWRIGALVIKYLPKDKT